jgi:hypothetical protein
MKNSIAFLLMITALCAAAQQPQTHIAPIYLVNAKYVNGVAPGYAPTVGSGLTLNLGGGTANCAGTIATYAAGTLTMTASTTNYVYLNTAASCIPAVKTTTFTSSDIPLAIVVTSSSAITGITDDRTMFQQPGSLSGGSSGHGVQFSIGNGSAAVPAAPYQNAPATGTISHCYWTTMTADASANLVFNVKLAGTNILSGTNATVSAGATPGTTATFSLTSSSVSVAQGNQWELDISAGSLAWTGVVQCY